MLPRALLPRAAGVLTIACSGHPSTDGVETYYDAARPFAAQSRLLAQSIQRHVVEEMARSGCRVRGCGAHRELPLAEAAACALRA